MRLSKLISQLDFFALEPFFLIKSDRSLSSPTGKLFTLIALALIAVTFSIFSQDMIYRKNPQVTYFKRYFERPPKIPLRELYFSIFFIYNVQYYILDPSIITIEAGIRRITTSLDSTIKTAFTPLSLEPCTYSHFPGSQNVKDGFKRSSIEKHLCINRASSRNFSIEGSWLEESYDSIFINFRKCENKTQTLNGPEIICKSPEVIKDYVTNGHFGMYFYDTLVNFEDFADPAKGALSVIFTKSSSSMYKQYLVFLKSGKVETDVGLITSSKGEQNYFGISEHREMVSDSVNPNFFASISIRNSELEEIYTRTYQKFQDVLAATAGFKEIIIAVASLFVAPTCLLELKAKVCNKVGKRDLKTPSQAAMKNKRDSKKLSDSLSYPDQVKRQPNEDNEKFFLHENLRKLKKKKKVLNLKERIVYAVTMGVVKSKRVKKLEGLFEDYLRNLDILSIIKNSRLQEKLCSILFDEYQNALIEALPLKSKPPKKKKSKKSKEKGKVLAQENVEGTVPEEKDQLVKALLKVQESLLHGSTNAVDAKLVKILRDNKIDIIDTIYLKERAQSPKN